MSKGRGESGTNKLEEQQIKETLQSLLVRPSGRARGAGGFSPPNFKQIIHKIIIKNPQNIKEKKQLHVMACL